ncbi:AraC-like DNA-binding protein [Bacillus pakistanensis]|uniref:AraC-like DNA-binding protein n=1 Tax=Rossellomorea pakistanensis TaxID=992288 RepID=A0ABS2NH10_9BACI|nr:AraC family transcriptional regulator [Bacillus pakistanensis]MBM7587108.1 AraC-like DNA-binding protein [Bacillus pakistanensis]
MGINSSTNYVLHATSNEFYWEGDGQLSLKTFANGHAHYKTSKGFFAVDESRYLLLNEGPYTISIEDKNVVESFCIFFKSGFAEQVSRSLEDSPDALLSDPYKRRRSIGFFEKTYQESLLLTSQLQKLKTSIPFYQDDLLWKEEQFHKIMQTILHIHNDTLREVHSLKALRFTTREELYRRIHTAHDYIRSFYTQQIQLEDIAQIACLSPNHLLRNYSNIFGKSPHQHIMELRVSKAIQLLSNLDDNITDISFKIGYNNPVSFSKMFKQHVGLSPLAFRKKVILDKK